MSRRANNSPNQKCVCIISQNSRALESDEKIQELCTTVESTNILQLAFKELGQLALVQLNMGTVLSLVAD